MTIEEYRCHGDETGWCGQPAAHVVQTLHGQRYACDRCALSREVKSTEPLGAWLARALGPQGAAMAEEEQRQCREMTDTETRRWATEIATDETDEIDREVAAFAARVIAQTSPIVLEACFTRPGHAPGAWLVVVVERVALPFVVRHVEWRPIDPVMLRAEDTEAERILGHLELVRQSGRRPFLVYAVDAAGNRRAGVFGIGRAAVARA